MERGPHSGALALEEAMNLSVVKTGYRMNEYTSVCV